MYIPTCTYIYIYIQIYTNYIHGYGSKNGCGSLRGDAKVGTKEYVISNEYDLFQRVWIGVGDQGVGSGAWNACASCASRIWIGTLQYSLSFSHMV